MQEGKSIKEYSTRVMNFVSQIKLFGEEFKDQRVVEKMMISLLEKFESKLSVIEKICDLEKLTVAELINKLQVQEQRVSIKNVEIIENTFQARQSYKFGILTSENEGQSSTNKGKQLQSSEDSSEKGKYHFCGSCGKSNHPESKYWKHVQCKICKKYDHSERVCWKRKNQASQQKNKSQQQQQPLQQQEVYFAENHEQQESNLFMMIEASCVSESDF